MQIRTEEQDDLDKLDITLMGKRESNDPMDGFTREEILKKVNGKYPDFPE